MNNGISREIKPHTVATNVRADSHLTSPQMTRHNATWTEEQYNDDSDISEEIEDDDPMSEQHGKAGYWDYRDGE